MDADWRPMQGSDPVAAGGDWRAQLQPGERSRIVDTMMGTLKKRLVASVPEELNELLKIAVLSEEKIYSTATNHSDYFREIYREMLSMEMETQQAPGNGQTGHAGAVDWQEEIYQMIKSLKCQYFAELNKLFDKVSVKLQHVDSIIPRQMPSEKYELMKRFKIMLNCIFQLLLINKSAIQPAMRDKVPQYEKQIINILNSHSRRSKPVQPQAPQQFQPPAGQASNSNISQQQQPSQSLQQHDSHTNPQASLPSMSSRIQSSIGAGIQYVPGPPTTNLGVQTEQNGANIPQQAGYNMEAAQRSNFSAWQSGSMGGALPQGSIGPMQGTMNIQLQTGSSSMLSHLSGQREYMTKPKWRDTL